MPAEAKEIINEKPIFDRFIDLFNIFAFYVRRLVPFFTVRLDIKVSYEHKKAWEPPVVCPTNWGLRIALSCWTDNARAHADMKYTTTWSSSTYFIYRYNTPLAVK